MALSFPRLAVLPIALLLAACEDPVALTQRESIPAEWQSVSAGLEHTCAIAQDGRAWCWGRATTARLGFLSRAAPCNRRFCSEPVPVVGDLEFEQLIAGNMHNCGVSRETAYCWGWGWWGQLGDVLTADQTCREEPRGADLPCSMEPIPVALGFEIVEATAGTDYSCAVTDDERAYCWGRNQHGQLGVGFSQDSVITPTPVAGAHAFRTVSPGSSHACAIDTAGEIWCWGSNLLGRLGTADYDDSLVPVQVADDLDGGLTLTWVAVDAGAIHTCGISEAGAAYCWGGNGGRIGDGTEWIWNFPKHVLIPEETGPVTRISAGSSDSCAVTQSGALYCWGENLFGQVGDGSLVPRLLPLRIAADITWADVSVGARHSCAIDVERRIYCWGEGRLGQLGNGDESDRLIPTLIAS